MSKNGTKKSGKKKWIVAGVIIAVLILVIFVVTRFSSRRTAMAGAGSGTAAISTEAVTTGSISVKTEGSGYVEAASTKAVALDYDGKLESIYVETGDQVQEGDVLAEYDIDALDSAIDSKEQEISEIESTIAGMEDSGTTVITAPVSGRVKRIYATVGNDVSKVVETNGGLAEISADGKLKVEFTCDTTSIVAGDLVTVNFDSYSVTGTVKSVNGENVCVTIQDDTEYVVDTNAVVYGRSGEKLGEGELKSNQPYMVRMSYGIISTVNVTTTTLVNAGDTMFECTDTTYNRDYLEALTNRDNLVKELQELEQYQKNPVVVSDYDGYIVTMDAMEGMTYEKGQQLCTIADEKSLNLKVDIDELDIDGVEVGQTAEVVFDAFEDETYEGTVEKISGVGENNGGVTTYTVTISIKLEDETKLKNAMSATASIIMGNKDNVLLVPVDAVESEDGVKYVQLMSGGQTIKTEIQTGLINNEYAEVTSGLNVGDLVVVPSKTEENIMPEMMGGMPGMGMGGSASGGRASGGMGMSGARSGF